MPEIQLVDAVLRAEGTGHCPCRRHVVGDRTNEGRSHLLFPTVQLSAAR